MSMSAAPAPAIGFLTVVEHAEFGLFGGYLILSPSGRPLEFHCTAPVKATRAQEILYGATLQEYLYEQIAPALVAKAKASPILLCTDRPLVWQTAAAGDCPLLLVLADEGSPPADALPQVLGKHRVVPRCGEDVPAIAQLLRDVRAETLDLLEPFARIREALEEAQKAARPAA